MKRVELYARVRHAVMIEGLSQREAARRFGIDPRTVKKMLIYSVPPGYVRTRLPVRPKLDPFIGVIDRILEEDKSRPKKQRHTSKRIFERLRDEYGFEGGITIVKDYICGAHQAGALPRHVPLLLQGVRRGGGGAGAGGVGAGRGGAGMRIPRQSGQ